MMNLRREMRRLSECVYPSDIPEELAGAFKTFVEKIHHYLITLPSVNPRHPQPYVLNNLLEDKDQKKTLLRILKGVVSARMRLLKLAPIRKTEYNDHLDPNERHDRDRPRERPIEIRRIVFKAPAEEHQDLWEELKVSINIVWNSIPSIEAQIAKAKNEKYSVVARMIHVEPIKYDENDPLDPLGLCEIGFEKKFDRLIRRALSDRDIEFVMVCNVRSKRN